MLTYSEITSNSFSETVFATAAAECPMPTERLPFKVRLATSDEQMQRVAQIRYAAYARHVPEFRVPVLFVLNLAVSPRRPLNHAGLSRMA